jgi:hypothetical protein
MLANQIDEKKFGSDFPNSTKIQAGDELDLVSFVEFTTPDKIRGVSITTLSGDLYHTTAKQPVGYILSPNVGLAELVKKASDKCVKVFFFDAKPDNSTRSTMLKASVYPQRKANN